MVETRDLLNRSVLILISLGAWLVADAAAAEPRIYWTEQTGALVRRAEIDGFAQETILDSGDGLALPFGIAIDQQGGTIYFTDGGPNELLTSDLEGDGLQTQAATSNFPNHVALDLAGGRVYWVDNFDDTVRSDALGGGDVDLLITVAGAEPALIGIGLDVPGGKMFFSDRANGRIIRADLDGTNDSDWLTGLAKPQDVAVDSAGGKIYWSEETSGKIRRADLATPDSNLEDIVTGLGSPQGVALDLAAGMIYWADETAGKIGRASMNGGGSAEDVITGLTTPRGIFVLAGPPQTPGLSLVGKSILVALLIALTLGFRGLMQRESVGR